MGLGTSANEQLGLLFKTNERSLLAKLIKDESLASSLISNLTSSDSRHLLDAPFVLKILDNKMLLFKSDYKNMKTKKNNVFSGVTRFYCLLNVGLTPTGTGDESTSNGNVSSLYFSGIRLMHL